MSLIAKFQGPGGPAQYGVVEGDSIFPLSGDVRSELTRRGTSYPLAAVRLLPPSVPTKIIAAGMNYYERVKELGMEMPHEPVFSYKPPSCVIGTEEPVVYPPGIQQLRYEAELAIIIKRKGKNIPESDAAEYILGYTACNDLSAAEFLRDQAAKAAGYDTFFPLGPFIATNIDPMNLTIELRVNGELRQQANTGGVKFSPAALVSYLSHIMTLSEGDVICTGTPPRPGFLKPGDLVEITLEHMGTLRNPVVAGTSDARL